MAVIFPTPPVGTILQPDRPAELLQGFLNIEQMEGVTNGKLTKANLDNYAQKRFFVADPNSKVSSYLNQNYSQIAALDGDTSSISANDLVQLRSGLPAPPTAPTPTPLPYPLPSYPGGNTGTDIQSQILPMMMTLMMSMLQLLMGFRQQ